MLFEGHIETTFQASTWIWVSAPVPLAAPTGADVQRTHIVPVFYESEAHWYGDTIAYSTTVMLKVPGYLCLNRLSSLNVADNHPHQHQDVDTITQPGEKPGRPDCGGIDAIDKHIDRHLGP